MQVTLRDVEEDDLPILFAHQREPDGLRMAAQPARDHEAFMAHWHTNVLGNPNVEKKTIVVDGEVAGHIDSWSKDGKQLVGYWLAQAHWGRGVATAALTELVTDHVHTRPLYAYVATQNVGSVRVLEKCGFVQVGDAVTGVEEALMQLL